jgi:hypothetical protein
MEVVKSTERKLIRDNTFQVLSGRVINPKIVETYW